MTKSTPINCLCGTNRFETVFVYDAPPKGEIKFAFSGSGDYYREVLRCRACGHFVSIHQMEDRALYGGDYVDSTYGENGILQAFNRITSLDPAKSDNDGRVRCILDFSNNNLISPAEENRSPALLDVGSGLCVFPYRMKQAGWECTALDPDARAVEHARERVGVTAVQGDFMTVELGRRFDLITFNKVLEHVKNPVEMLARSLHFLNDRGFVYVELPDGEAAVHEGPEREEFCIEHHHIFSFASLAILAARTGLLVKNIERVREPSTKFTLRAFMVAS